MDMEISITEANQSTSNTMQITKESNEDSGFKPILSKSQKKKLRKKEKAEREVNKTVKSLKVSLDPSAKVFTPPTKVIENEASTVITGYLPANNSQAFVRDIIVYDIPAKWDNYTTINALSAWKKVISMTIKRQKKYKTLHVNKMVSSVLVLKERKERERYQAVVLNPPESMTTATLIHKDNEAYLISHNINMFKEVKLPDGKRKIIGYLSNWDNLYRLINTPNVWNDETVDWTHHTSPSHNPRKSTRSTRDKSQGKTKSTNASSPNDSARKRSSKKVATGANNIPLQCRGSTSQRQYSSGTKPGQDSPKTDYDNKKLKSKSKRSSTSKKMIMAEITRMNEVLESLLKRTAI
ncbi:hypothetical protein RclHR1_06330001 [Rhizophagus clarus]|uniref:Uncharacterized protein n=1 Tax=Rhizophagus clarus TaxID=94130 RepID=A0A2Z6RTL7_9GLOM|nr:hypothetical protein RclHR1_06330001 [Rhizophagus clarus]